MPNSYSTSSSAATAVDAADIMGKPEVKAGIEELTLEILTTRLDSYKTAKIQDAKKVKENQSALHKLHEVLAKINAMTDGKNGKLKMNDELLNLVDEAKGILADLEGVDLTTAPLESGKTYSSDERQRLIENVRMASENLKTEIESNLSKMRETTNGYYEVLKLAMDIIKILDTPKRKVIGGISGR